MSHRSRAYRLLCLAPLIAVLAACSPSQEQEESSIQPRVKADPPPAEAPPDAGVNPPEVRLLAANTPPVTVRDRPQQQLAGWSESLADELNIPRAALQAYGYAARVIERDMPRCQLDWPVLAGIGAVESSHGRYGGAKLDQTGRPSIDIRGMPLDGRAGVKRIEDTDGGELDGDTHFDRAIGPLQFIPKTWRKWAADADGDGNASPDDIDDAALAAAKYLCTVGGDLRQPDGFWSALLTYNESRDYGQDVLDHADQYGKASRSVHAER